MRKAAEDPLPGQINDPAPPVVIEGKEEWEVDDVLDARRRRGKVQFRVKWKDHPEDPDWYDANGFENAKEIVEDFYLRYPSKPRWNFAPG